MRYIQTTRLTLEPLLESHAPAMFEILSDPAIYEFENEPPSSAEYLAQRYRRLEHRSSPDNSQRWLNWVIRQGDRSLCGYVQATVFPNGTACIAYELNSRYWRKGIATEAVAAMLDELRDEYAVAQFVAVLKSANYRSMGLLKRLNFRFATIEQAAEFNPQSDELAMVRDARRSADIT